MNTFGIRMSEPNYPHNHYVAGENVPDDAVLFDWLTADNFTPSDESGVLDVLAPEGYLFVDEMLVPVSECSEDEVRSVADEDSDVWRDWSVRTAYRHEDKANLLLEGVMKSVSPAEFYALGIPENRVLTFTID